MIDWILKLFGAARLSEHNATVERMKRYLTRARAVKQRLHETERELHRMINQSASLYACYSDQKRRNVDLKAERTTLRDSLADATKEHRDSLFREEAAEAEVAALQQSLDCQKEILARNDARHQQECGELAECREKLSIAESGLTRERERLELMQTSRNDCANLHTSVDKELIEYKKKYAYAMTQVDAAAANQSTVTNEMWRLAREKENLEKANKGLKKSLSSVKNELSALEKDVKGEVPRGTTQERRTSGDISYLRAKLVSCDKEIENLNVRVKHNAAAYHTSCMELRSVRRNYQALRDERDNKKNALGEISEISTRNI